MLNLLSVTLGVILLLASTDKMSGEVELLAVVWEVRESVLYRSSSQLLSSSPDMESGGDGIIIGEAFGSTGVGLACGLVVTLGLPLEVLATLGITSPTSSSSSQFVGPSSTYPPSCLTLPCTGNKRFL